MRLNPVPFGIDPKDYEHISLSLDLSDVPKGSELFGSEEE